MRNSTEKIALSGMFLAIGIILPEFFPTQDLRVMFSPMHIPVFVAGLLLGWKYGVIVGVITPLLRSVMMGMPPIMPTGITMALELATYGGIIGIMYEKIRVFKQPLWNAYLALIIAMIAGRITYGLFQVIYLSAIGQEYGLQLYFTAVFIRVIPAIVVQLLLIPSFVQLLSKRAIGPSEQ